MQAMDIDAPVITAELGGRAYELRFDNEQIRRTELCYSAATGVRMGYLGILTQANQKIFGALCALCWGAISSAEIRDHVPGRQRTTFADFDAHVSYRELIEQADDIVSAAMVALEAGKGGQGKKRMTPSDNLPWGRMMRAALEAGVSVSDFWRLSPAAVLRLTRRQTGNSAPKRIGGLADCP